MHSQPKEPSVLDRHLLVLQYFIFLLNPVFFLSIKTSYKSHHVLRKLLPYIYFPIQVQLLQAVLFSHQIISTLASVKLLITKALH